MKKLLSLLLAVLTLVTAVSLCACDSDGSKTIVVGACDSDGSKTIVVGACDSDGSKTIVVGASSTPHAEILEQCKAALEEKGYKLDIRVYDDYVLPNTATEDGDLDANYFQHTPYLNDFNANNETHLVSVAAVHYEPFGLYAGTSSSLTDLPAGAKIAVPNDGSNEARALFLLEACGLIKLKEGTGFTATKQDIAEDNGYEIVEMEAALIPGCLDSVNLAVINGNYAIGAGLKIADALATEDKNSEAAKTYANVLVVKEGNENNEGILALVEVLKSEAIAKFIEEQYAGAVVPMS